MYIRKKVKRFSLGNIQEEIKKAVEELSQQVKVEFPKEEKRWLSHYVYRDLKIHIDSKGNIKGGLLRLIFSLVDFGFIRSLVADCYSIEGGKCYDSSTMLLLDVIKIWNNYEYYPDFIEDLKDKERGAQYRYYTGLDIENVPTEATFLNYQDRIGEVKYQAVLGFLVKIFNIIGIISGKILCTDGTLIKAFARYRGCTYMEECCKCVMCPESIIDDINGAIEKAVAEMERKGKHSAIASVKMQCPRDDIMKKLIELVKKKDPKALIEDIGAFSVIKLHLIKGIIPEFNPHRKYIDATLRSSIKIPGGYSVEIISCSIYRDTDGRFRFECPRASKDITARVGYRRSKDDPNKLEKVFGYKAVIITSVEIEFNIEIPVAVMTGAGNLNEAESFLKLHRQLKKHVSFKTEYQIQDSGYDYDYVYEYIRDGNGKPIIDYNKRREKLDKKSLRRRGYDEDGYPYAPCGRVCKPNGFDYERKALKNICGRQCLQCKTAGELPKCPHRDNKQGYTKWMSIVDLPRLILEVPRGSRRYKRLKAIRSSSERTNSYGKEWAGISNLKIWGINAYATRVALCCIVMLLKKIMEFILRATIVDTNPALAEKLYNRKAKRMLKNCA